MRISKDELHFGKVIGCGSFGKVYRGLWKGNTVALKSIKLPPGSETKFPHQNGLQTLKIAMCWIAMMKVEQKLTSLVTGVVFEDSFTNESNVEQERTFKQSTSTTASFTWTMTEALNVGLPLSGSASVPLVAYQAVP